MKRRSFFGTLGLAAAAIAAPSVAKAVTVTDFAHSPADYAQVQEEPYEFEELDEALTDEQFKWDIVWE
jgi:threonine dehydrogenase-like Zn-dependent dehydrogenase